MIKLPIINYNPAKHRLITEAERPEYLIRTVDGWKKYWDWLHENVAYPFIRDEIPVCIVRVSPNKVALAYR